MKGDEQDCRKLEKAGERITSQIARQLEKQDRVLKGMEDENMNAAEEEELTETQEIAVLEMED